MISCFPLNLTSEHFTTHLFKMKGTNNNFYINEFSSQKKGFSVFSTCQMLKQGICDSYNLGNTWTKYSSEKVTSKRENVNSIGNNCN